MAIEVPTYEHKWEMKQKRRVIKEIEASILIASFVCNTGWVGDELRQSKNYAKLSAGVPYNSSETDRVQPFSSRRWKRQTERPGTC